jgi:phosphatidylglycerol lysyltransferase
MSPERRRAHALIVQHGWNSTSFQVLEDGYQYWFWGDEACVAYVDTGRAWVVAGAPIAPEAQLGEVVTRFLEEAQRAGRRVCFFAVEARLLAQTALRGLPIGEQAVWDPRGWSGVLAGAKSLREQLRRARAKGVTVRRLTVDELEHHGPALDGLAERWLAGRALAPLGFLVELELFRDPHQRRYFVAEQGGRVVGALTAVPVYAREGWLLEDLLRDASAPNGTAELLVDAAMTTLAAEGSSYVTLGPRAAVGRAAAAAGAGPRGHAAAVRLPRAARLQGQAAPRALGPDLPRLRARAGAGRARRATGLRPREPAGLRAAHDLARTHAGRARARPGAAALDGAASRWRPLRRGSCRAPCSGRGWPSIWAWRRGSWRSRGAGVAGWASRWPALVTADALLTLAIAVLWNGPRARGPLDVLVLLVACAAPAAGAAILWGAVRRREALDG